MPLSWNFDPVIRNWLIIGLVLFCYLDLHLIGLLLSTQIWWSEFDEDRAGYDLEEYIEHHLDEFGHFDTWAGDVYKSAEKYGDVAENYAKTHQTRHTLFRRLYKSKDDEVIKEFDYAYWEENYDKIEKDITETMREGLKKEKIMYEQYKQDNQSIEENAEKARHVYEQFLSARVGENIRGFSSSKEEEGDIDATDIDDSGAELQYIYLLSEKMFEWIHSTAYEENDSSFMDIEELWKQSVFSQQDKRMWNLNYINTYNMIKDRRAMSIDNSIAVTINYQTELKMQPYPIFASWLQDCYSIVIKRQKNNVDYDIVSKLLSASQPEKMTIVSETQEHVKLSETIRQQRAEKNHILAMERQKALDKIFKAYNDSVKNSIHSFRKANDRNTITHTSMLTADKIHTAKTKSVKKKKKNK